MPEKRSKEIRERIAAVAQGLEPEKLEELLALTDELAVVRGQVRHSHNRLQSIVKTAVDGIVTIDTAGTVIDFNEAAERLFGYRADEVIGRNVNMLMPEPYRTEHDAYVERYLRTNEPHIIGIGREVVGRRKNGTTFPMDLAVSEFEVEDTRQFTGIVRDITERKTLERERARLISQLEDKNAELERFTYTVSHDLKSPLITIKGFLGMLESDAKSGNIERMRQDMDRIGKAADKMKELLDEVLQLSRIGRVANPSEEMPFSEVVEEVLGLLDGPLRQRGIEVVVQPDLPTIYGDRVRMREVVQNLIENAIKFMGPQDQPRIEIGSAKRDGELAYYVRDNGVGIDPRYARKVFDLFDQLDPSQPGSGVGLALVKRIVEVHGGRAWVESQGAGQGSTFWFTIADAEEDRGGSNG